MKSKTTLNLRFFQTNSHPQNLNKAQLNSALYALFILLGMSNSSFGQLVYVNTVPQVQQLTRSGIVGSPSQTYTFIAGATDNTITVECWGAGGGGSIAKTNDRAVAGGGGGAYARSIITVTPCQQYTVVVGGGGEGYALNTGPDTDNAFQRDGQPSFFIRWGTTDTLVKAAGGKSGRTNTLLYPGLGGAAANCIGGVVFKGGDGVLSTSTSPPLTYRISGAGGGGAGSTGAGGNAIAGLAGSGGSGTTVGGGNGANGVTTGPNIGNTGSTYGGGGSGAFKGGGGSDNSNGGFGATGAVRITGSSQNCLFPLPIELTRFEGELNCRIIDLSWTTASEINNDYFIVKRSYDGTNWNDLAQINGAGNHQGELNYTLTDDDFDQAYSSVYYALSQVDYDGTISPERKIAVSLEGLWNELTIFPNPASELLHVKFKSNEKREKLMLLDMVGKDHLSNVQIETFGEESEIAINVSSLTDGIYIIVYGTERLKFVKKETKD